MHLSIHLCIHLTINIIISADIWNFTDDTLSDLIEGSDTEGMEVEEAE